MWLNTWSDEIIDKMVNYRTNSNHTYGVYVNYRTHGNQTHGVYVNYRTTTNQTHGACVNYRTSSNQTHGAYTIRLQVWLGSTQIELNPHYKNARVYTKD